MTFGCWVLGRPRKYSQTCLKATEMEAFKCGDAGAATGRDAARGAMSTRTFAPARELLDRVAVDAFRPGPVVVRE